MKNDDRKKIKVLMDGPLLVTGNLPLDKEVMVIGADNEPERWERKVVYPTGETYALCRCGASENKPFCDGTHLKDRFDDGDESIRKD